MPVVVGPGSSLGTPVTSSDGRLTCTPDPSTASVLIRVSFIGVSGGLPDRVTVVRTVAGVSRPVMGLDWYTSPGAVTAGIDHFAQLGVTATYQAFAANSVTGTTWSSTTVAVSTPAPLARKGWIKSTRPALSVSLSVLSWPDFLYPIPMGVFTPVGAKYSTFSEGERQAGSGGQVSLGTMDAPEMNALRALLQFGGPLLLQTETVHGAMRPDVWVHAGDVQPATPVQQMPFRQWSVPVWETAEPPTRGVQVPIPGHTYADSKASRATYAARTGNYRDRLTT